MNDMSNLSCCASFSNINYKDNILYPSLHLAMINCEPMIGQEDISKILSYLRWNLHWSLSHFKCTSLLKNDDGSLLVCPKYRVIIDRRLDKETSYFTSFHIVHTIEGVKFYIVVMIDTYLCI